jgi:hypothetical protein
MNDHWRMALETLKTAAKLSIYGPDPDPVPGGPKPPPKPAVVVSAVSAPPCTSFYTLPELFIWTDWILGKTGYHFGRNRVPSGDFNDPDAITSEGWVDVGYRTDGIISKIETARRNQLYPGDPKPKTDDPRAQIPDWDLAVKLSVKPEKPEELDTNLPAFLDFPVAAIRSPPIRVEGNNLIRISVLVKWPMACPRGAGGVIVRDSIGGEQFQFRSADPIPDYSRVVLFRKAPADGTFTVTLGLAAYGEAFFDDLQVEVIEDGPRTYNAAGLVQEREVPSQPRPRARSRSGAPPRTASRSGSTSPADPGQVPSRRRVPNTPPLPDPSVPSTAASPNDSQPPRQ